MKRLLAIFIFSFGSAYAQPVGPMDYRTLGTPNGPAQLDSSSTLSGNSATAIGSTTARTLASRAADLVNVKDGYNGQAGAKGDGQLTSTAVSINSASQSLTVGSNLFTSADVGKLIFVGGAGIPPTTGAVTTIPMATQGLAYSAVPTCGLTDASSSGSGATCSALMAVQTATLTTGGSGCTNGVQTFIVGIDGTGTPAQFTGTVSAGALSGALTIVAPGQFSGIGAVTLVPSYGANCTVAPTVAVSYGVGAVQVTAWGTAYSTTQTTAALSGGGSPSPAATLGTPGFGAAVPPLKATITGYTSPTQVTLSVAAGMTLSAVTTKIAWGTNDSVAIQGALTHAAQTVSTVAGGGIYLPPGIYIAKGLDPGAGPITVLGSGMNNTIVLTDNGTSLVQDSGDWTPFLKNISGSPDLAGLKSSIELEDFQIRGLLDLGQVNVGPAMIELNNYTELKMNRMKLNQVPRFGMAAESIRLFSVTDSVFENVMRDNARCRSCFSAIVTGNKFRHSDDDAIALHQANYIQGAGVIREGIHVENNELEDTAGIHLLGARQAVVRGNILRRVKVDGIVITADASEGINQIYAVDVADNIITDFLNRPPFIANGGAVIQVNPSAANAPSGLTQYIPGANIQGTSYFGKPWDYAQTNVLSGTAFSPPARGINIHDNQVMRTLPAVANYSAWGYGMAISSIGFIDPPVPDAGMIPGIGIRVSANSHTDIHHNDIENLQDGIAMTDTVIAPSLTALAITDNYIYDTYNGGIVASGGGTLGSAVINANMINVDPYQRSPGRAVGNTWTSSYGSSKCVSWSYSGMVQMALNTFENCYAVMTTTTNWVLSKNVIRGLPSASNLPGALTYSSINAGIGTYPPIIGDQFIVVPIAVNSINNGPTSFGALSVTHVTSAAAAPTSGVHYMGDVIWSTAPATCACVGWLAITTGSAWVAGTDYKVLAAS